MLLPANIMATVASAGQTSHGDVMRVLNETRRAMVVEQRAYETAMALPVRVQRWVNQRKSSGAVSRRRQRRRAERLEAAVSTPTPSHLLLVLGIISNPRTPHTREWIRSTYLSGWSRVPQEQQSRVLMRFVMGKRGLNAADQRKLSAEDQAHGDLEYIDASDFGERGGIFSCIDKLFAWFPHAFKAFPGARFYAKADDDSYVDVGRLLSMLAPLSSVPLAYMGYTQYDSFITDEWKHCGWSAGPIGAVDAHRGCPRDRTYGPFPFIVGALTIMGSDLASWMAQSADLEDLVRRGRASQASPKRHWDCGYSDVTLGFAFARANLSVSLVSMRDAMRDATYGAMNAQHFVVAHHLRTKKAFEQAHTAAMAAPQWTPRVRECTSWPQVADVPRERMPQLTDSPPAELRRAMLGFGCCQRWQVCEVSPVLPS